MRRLMVLGCLVCFFVISVKGQKASKIMLLSLDKGEQLVYGENCFDLLSGGKNTLIFSSKKNNGKIEFFSYEKGVKNGPYSAIKLEMVKCSGSFYTKNCARQPGSYDMDEVRDKYFTVNESDGKSTIKFKGKSYGPYYGVSHFCVTQDNSRFYAIVVTGTDMKTEFISSDGKILPVESSVDGIFVSPDGNEAYAFQKGLVKIEDLMNSGGDLSKINMNDFDKVVLININGKKLGPYDKMSNGDFWYCKSNNHLLYRTGNDIYIDGKKFITLKETPDPCTFWLSKDSKNYAIVSYDNIYFSDGETYSYPLELEYVTQNGKTYLWWVALENETNLVLYKKEF